MRDYAEALRPVVGSVKPKGMFRKHRETLTALPDGRCTWNCDCERCFERPERKETWAEFMARTKPKDEEPEAAVESPARV